MARLDRIKRIFPEEWTSILKGCDMDPALVEICEDLDRLSADLEKADGGKAFMSDSLKADVLGSIEALIEEIREKTLPP
ncbi:MAG: hypothetical protein ABJJ37_07975 [Roseibium sp.]